MDATPAATGALLWGRAVVLSAVALLAGAVAHVQADGLLPGTTALVAIAGAGALACAPLLRRQVSTWRIVALLVAGQSAVHMALAVNAGHRGDPVSHRVAPAVPAPAPATSRHGSYFDVAYAPKVGDGAGSGAGLSVPAPVLHAFADLTAHPTMAVAHLLAAAACGWYLAQGERALWRLLELTARGWAGLVTPSRWCWTVPTLELELPPLATVALVPRPTTPLLCRSVSRRGPPLAA